MCFSSLVFRGWTLREDAGLPREVLSAVSARPVPGCLLSCGVELLVMEKVSQGATFCLPNNYRDMQQ